MISKRNGSLFAKKRTSHRENKGVTTAEIWNGASKNENLQNHEQPPTREGISDCGRRRGGFSSRDAGFSQLNGMEIEWAA